MKKFIYTIIALSFVLAVSAQQSFHRLYDVFQDSTHRLTDGIVTNGGGYATLGQSIFVDMDNNLQNSYRAIFTTYDGKGDLDIKNDIYLADSTTLRSTSDLVQLSTGNFVITASLFLDDQSAAIVGMDGTTGIPTWSKTMANEYQSKVSLSTFLDDEILVGSITTDSSIWLAKMNGIDGTDTWSKIYTAAVESNDEVSALIYDIHTSVLDSNVFITGKSEIEDVEGYHLTKLDTSGAVLWSTHTDSIGFRFTPYGLTETLDSSIYIVGEVANVSGLQMSFTSKYDKDGQMIWCKTLTGTSNMAIDIVPFGSNLVFSNIRTEDAAQGPTISSLYEIDSSGMVLNSQIYGDSTSLYIPSGSLHNTEDGGLAMFGTHFKAFETQTSDIVKTDSNLQTPCSNSGSGSLIDFPTLSQSLIWTSIDFNDSDTLETDANVVNYYDVPTISPSSDQWCPNEPIIDTLDATPSPLPDGVITYAWMGPGVDGNTNPFVVGMEEGEYMVTVTINDRHCYTLCDTINISRLAEPTLGITVDFSPFCSDGTVNLLGSPTGVEPFESVEWSVGGSDPVINVDTEGTYSLTIVDACMETATGSIDVTFPEQLENLAIDVTLGEDCERILTAVTNIDGQVGVTYEWTDSLDVFIDDDRSIEVTESGVYFVTVDYCGRSFTEEEDLKLDNNLLWPKVFFPRGEDENKTFGPVNPCGALVTNYSLKIYNRCGNEVFTSDNIDAEWNGQHGGSDSATAVYVWLADYAIDGVQITEPQKGDVTLLR